MRHPPYAVLVGDKKVVALPREAVGPVEVFDVAIDPLGVALAVVAQKRDVARTLLGHQHVAVGEHEEPARVRQPSCERRGHKALRHLERLSAIRDYQRPVRHDWAGLWSRQIGRIDVIPPTDLVLGGKIPFKFAFGFRYRATLCGDRV